VLSTNGSLTAGVDPEPRTKGLTDKILSLATADRLTPTAIDIDNLTVVVQAREFRDPTTPAFEEVKPRIVTTLKELAQKKLAEQRAKDLLAAAKANPQNFKKEAEARRAKVSGPVQISRAEATTQRDAASLPPAIRSASLRVSAPTVLDATYPSANGYTVAVVTDINKPKSPPSKSDIAKYREQGASEASSASIDAVLDAVKASAELDIDEQLLVAQ
jgi:hypothetical protein